MLADPQAQEKLIRTLRATLAGTTAANSRIGASIVGRQLDLLLLCAGTRPGVSSGVEAVRDGSLAYLKSLHGRGDVVQARRLADLSTDHLEASLAQFETGCASLTCTPDKDDEIVAPPRFTSGENGRAKGQLEHEGLMQALLGWWHKHKLHNRPDRGMLPVG
jgi:hypothetical protein